MDDFSKAQLGDRLWSIQLGECEVVKIECTHKVINVKNDLNLRMYYLDGKYNSEDAFQSLFWTNPNIIPPPKPKPKQKIKGFLERWVVVYKEEEKIFDSDTFNSYEECLDYFYSNKNNSAWEDCISTIVKIEIPYEFEEG